MLLCIPKDRLAEAWPLVEPWLKAVEGRSRGHESVGALADDILQERAQLWVWIDKEVMKALAVTEIVSHPGVTVCRVRICTGKERHEWLAPGLARIEEWAASVGCHAVEPVARLGWERDLKALGYRAHHVIMGKRVAP